MILSGLLCSAALADAPKPSSTSTSRQFIVYGDDVRLRGALCDLAERTKSNLLRLLAIRDNWKTPLVINLDYARANFPDAPPPPLEVSQTGFGLKLQLNFLVTANLNGRAVQRKLLSAILIEMMYRDRADIVAGSRYVAPPDWLIDGVLALAPERDPDDNAQLLQTMVATKNIAPLEGVVRQSPALLDASSRRIYDAYSMALVQLLLESPDGRPRLARFIGDLPEAPNDPVADLCAHFPATLGRSPNKWWTLSVAHVSTTDRYETLSAAETAAQLDRALRFSIPGADGISRDYSLGDYATYRKLSGRRAALQQLQQQLLLLRARAHPSYRAILEEEYALAESVARGKARKLRERLARVASHRERVEREAAAIDDYLNWYEATQLKSMSGAFSPILDPADESQPRRRDPISVYLDSIEIEMQ